jgi:stage II sporulation protein D
MRDSRSGFLTPRLVFFGLLVAAAGALLFAGLRRPAPRRAAQALPRGPAPAAVVPPPAPLRPSGLVRIGLVRRSGGASIAVTPLAAGAIVDAATGRRLARLPARRSLALAADYATAEVAASQPGVAARGRELILSGGLLKIGTRRYPGRLRVRVVGTGLDLVNEVEIEDYLRGVLPGEIPPGFLPEAQKALAVAARTYALVQSGKHGEFDLCDGPHCQMYVGHRASARRGLAAVKATRHLCVWSGRELAYTFYEADCGGESTSAETVPLSDKPPGPIPYLVPVRDAGRTGPDYCAESPYHRWVRQFPREELERRLATEPETVVGRLLGLRITESDPTGRALAVEIRSESLPEMTGFTAPDPNAAAETRTVSAWIFRRAVGPLALKSLMMRLSQPKPEVYRFAGSGFGHGLGLCQIGANGMAKRGFTFRQILAHYYPGTKVRALPAR